MYHPKKKKELSIVEELKELELQEEGEMVDIPDLEIDDLLEENSLSVIVRFLNPFAHKVGGLVKALPPIWGLEDRVHGRGVGPDRVQFIFESDRDLQYVLTRGPWFVNGWIVSLDQWSSNPGPYFLCKIPFWIRVRGLPIHLLKKQAVDSLLGPLGYVEKVELHAKNSSSVEYVRALVWINADEPLQFRRIARFKSGDVIPTELEYERLIKICFLCKRLTHDQSRCPTQAMPQTQNQNLTCTQGRGTQRRDMSEGTTDPRRGAPKKVSSNVDISLSRSSLPSGSKHRNTLHPSESRKKADLKGKGVARGSSQIWKPKADPKTPIRLGANSKSSGEFPIPNRNRSNSSGKRTSKGSPSPRSSKEIASSKEIV